MNKVRAKFVVVERSEFEHGGFKVTLRPVTGGSAENTDFYKWTPAGQIVLETINAKAAEVLKPGSEMYVDFTPAPADTDGAK